MSKRRRPSNRFEGLLAPRAARISNRHDPDALDRRVERLNMVADLSSATAMKRWLSVGSITLALSLFGCKKDDACPAAKKAAASDLSEALAKSELERRKLETVAQTARQRGPLIADEEKSFNTDLEGLEQSMDCLRHADCCVRFAKTSQSDRANVGQAGADVRHRTRLHDAPLEDLDLQRDLAGALKTFSELMDQDGAGRSSTNPAEATRWCTAIRAELPKIRAVTPAIWKRAVEDADKLVADADAAVARAQAHHGVLEEWATALKASKRPATAANASEPGEAFVRVRESVKRYEDACF
jgi:hypothetical protein